jgi:hypothetical protein
MAELHRRLLAKRSRPGRRDGFVNADPAAFRNGRVLAETLKLVQAGEREVHGLDFSTLDVASMTDEELQAVVDGKSQTRLRRASLVGATHRSSGQSGKPVPFASPVPLPFPARGGNPA